MQPEQTWNKKCPFVYLETLNPQLFLQLFSKNVRKCPNDYLLPKKSQMRWFQQVFSLSFLTTA